MTIELNTIGNFKHAYQLGVSKNDTRGQVMVYANNRAQATRIAERAGYYVRDCNMIG